MSRRRRCLPYTRGHRLTAGAAPFPGTLTIRFVAVRGLNANQDVLVQQVLGVRDNGLQLHREGHRVRELTAGAHDHHGGSGEGAQGASVRVPWWN